MFFFLAQHIYKECYNIRSVTTLGLNVIEQALLNQGGMLSTELKQFLMDNSQVNADTARKRISRAVKSNSNICKLTGLSFRNKAVFYYHKNNFGSPMYWDALFRALNGAKSVYAFAIAALIARNKIIPTEHFPIHCGAPFRMAKNISCERVLKDLKGINAIREDFIPKVGDCISLIQEDDFIQHDGERIKARLLAEDILINVISSWLKKLNFVSFEKIALNRSEKYQPVNGFYWDISAPSYLTSLTTFENGKKKPGFVVCDVILDCTIDDVALSPFLNKVIKSQFSRLQGRCMYILVAENFTEDAFKLAKQAGIIPATTRNLFGKDVEEALKSVISVFSHMASFINAPEQIEDLFTRLEKIEGAVGNLRGTLFEFIVAESLREIHSNVVLGKKLKSLSSSKKYDADVIVRMPLETLIIECKAGYAEATLSHSEVKHWLQEQVPNMYKTLLHQDDEPNRKYIFELWSTKKLSDESIELLNTAISNLKKYTVVFKIGQEVRQQIKKSNKQTLLNLLDQHYLKHPLQST
jgi:hypothetical protein